MNKAKINEVFSSIQGEGIYAGQTQVFVRFAGCNLDCVYCDTETDSFKELSKNQLLAKIAAFDKGNDQGLTVSFTGGEPLMHSDFLLDLLPACKRRNYRVYLETNGTLADELLKIIEYVDIIAMDIKLPSSSGSGPMWQAHKKFLCIASAKEVFVKIIITKDAVMKDLKQAVEIVKDVDVKIPFVIQPAADTKRINSPGRQMISDFLKFADRHLSDTRVMPQIHKLIGVK